MALAACSSSGSPGSSSGAPGTGGSAGGNGGSLGSGGVGPSSGGAAGIDTGGGGGGGGSGNAGSTGGAPDAAKETDAGGADSPSDGPNAPVDRDLVRFVNPFIGTAPANSWLGFYFAGGDVFPGAAYPLGMLALSPDTPSPLPGGYDYRDTKIKGFSLTHFSGRGVSVYMDVPFIPWVGPMGRSPGTNAADYASTFSHANESASAGYYKVHLDGINVDVELTTVARAGIQRFTFPKGSQATLFVNAGGSINGTTASSVAVSAANRTVTGSATSHIGGSSIPYTIYFAARFDVPFASFGTWSGGAVSASSPASSSPASGAYLTFDTSSNQVVQAKVAVSYVGLANAQQNLDAEMAGTDFAAMRAAAAAAWNKRLNLIQVDGGTDDQKTSLYTALYHVFFHPNVFNDSNGQYIGFDKQVHQVAAGHAQYHNIPGWDEYRTNIRLRAILTQDEASDIAQSLVNDALQGDGRIPRWEQTNADSHGMIGDGGTIIVSEAHVFGARAFDATAALAAAVAGQSKIRENSAEYVSLGYVAQESASDSAAQTLEYSHADAAIAELARGLGDMATYAAYKARGNNWMKLFNPATGYIQPRHRAGGWDATIDPASGAGFNEGSAAQYLWMVTDPHDLVGLLGGPAKMISRLDTYFTKLDEPPTSIYAFMGNEPDFQDPWLYDFVGAPAKTAAVLRRIQDELFTNKPSGMPGNDDAGSTSSWYVFSALGLYPIYPGVAGFVVSGPAFTSMTVRLRSGVLKIVAPNASPTRPYIQALKIDGTPTSSLWIPWDRVARGATLEFDLTDDAATPWGTAAADAPPRP
ncbi:MAG TPA: GH92 family glycosyl hydrolase [Polyangia bacterium]|nr:GH92 family glycosyl hydrolase [Polyangia bacterium]